MAICNIRRDSRLTFTIWNGAFAPLRTRRIGGTGYPCRSARYDVHCRDDRRKQATGRMIDIQIKRFTDEHDCDAWLAAVVAGKTYGGLPAKKDAAASPLLLSCDPKSVAISTDEEQRNGSVEDGRIGTLW